MTAVPSVSRAVVSPALVAVLVVTGGLGLAEEVWRNFLSLHLKDTSGQVLQAVKAMGVFALLLNLVEGAGYIVGGRLAHRLGPRLALAISALPMLVGFGLMLGATTVPWIVLGAILTGGWEPLSVPATFDVVGAEVPKNKRTTAFAVQAIQKRLPKIVGPLLGGALLAVGYWANVALAVFLVVLTLMVQAALTRRMQPHEPLPNLRAREALASIPPHIRSLLTAEVMLRWGEWFVRDFAVLYMVGVLGIPAVEAAGYIALQHTVSLLTYIPMGRIVDRAESPRVFIGISFFLFAMFPLCLAFLPGSGLPLPVALAVTFALNGLRETGEPARKALVTTSIPKDSRAQAVGLYWGLRSLMFSPAPVMASLIWDAAGPKAAFVAGGCLGLLGTAWFWTRVDFPAGESRAADR